MRRRLAAAILLGLATPASAGPPFITDDPEPTERGHWEIYNFAVGTETPDGLATAAGIDLNYGGLPGVQLTATLPVGLGKPLRYGNTELAVKYRFLHRDRLSLAVFPRVILPTGSGGGRATLLLPVWAQRDIGAWTIFGGAGYSFQPGGGGRAFWQEGLVVTRHFGTAVSLGVEVAHRGPNVELGREYTAVQLGMIVHLTGPLSLLLAGGPGIENRDDGGRYNFYSALALNF